MPPFVGRVLSRLLGEYSIYRVLCHDDTTPRWVPTPPAGVRLELVEAEDLAASREALMRDQAWYGGSESRIYGCWIDGQIVACCIYWYGARYRTRNFWPLRQGQAKLVQVVTLPSQRGRGWARLLIAFSGDDMRRVGFETLFARVWHSNTPSMSAFEAAGWRRIATVVEFHLLGIEHKSRWVFGAKPSATDA